LLLLLQLLQFVFLRFLSCSSSQKGRITFKVRCVAFALSVVVKATTDTKLLKGHLLLLRVLLVSSILFVFLYGRATRIQGILLLWVLSMLLQPTAYIFECSCRVISSLASLRNVIGCAPLSRTVTVFCILGAEATFFQKRNGFSSFNKTWDSFQLQFAPTSSRFYMCGAYMRKKENGDGEE